MKKKILIMLLVFLLIILSSLSIASATYYHDGVGYKDIAKEVFTYNYFNGTIKEKYVILPGDNVEYLVDVNGTTFYLKYNIHDYKKVFNVGDKVTIYGSAVNHKDNMHSMHSWEFNGRYSNSQKFPMIYLGGDFKNGIRLAEGVRGGNSYSSSSSSSNKGISFLESKQYFPNASDTVRKHVFDEADRNGDGYLSKSEYKIFKDVKRFTKDYANVKNNEYVETPDLWNGDGTTRTRYCADHGRVAVGVDDKCPWCKKYRRDPRTRVKSTRYV